MTTQDPTQTSDLSTLKRQLSQLEELRRGGALPEAAYQESRALIERKILDAVLAHPGAGEPQPQAGGLGATTPTTAPAPAPGEGARPPYKLLAVVAGAALVLAAGAYFGLGRSSTTDDKWPAAQEGQGAAHSTDPGQITAMVESLAAKLKDKPDDGQGWGMLARSYSVLGRNPEALAAYEKALKLLGDDPVLLADYADALAVKQQGTLAGEPLKLVQRALKKDPKNVKALYLQGTEAFGRKDYRAAVRDWDKAVEFAPADHPLRAALQSSLTEARQLGGMPAKVADAPLLPGIPSGKSLQGTVSLGKGLTAKPEDTVFIFARPAEGSKMPLAVLRKQVKDLPFKFTLDDSLSMTPDKPLSAVGRVVVGARISASGQATPQPGDLTGQTATVSVGDKDLVVEINDTVRP